MRLQGQLVNRTLLLIDAGISIHQRWLPRSTDPLRLTGTMSAVGNPYDNEQAESFLKTLKVEEVTTPI